MRSHDFYILALEPDPTRAQNLKRLIRKRVDAEVMVASSSGGAIAALSGRVPDLVLTSALASPTDDEQLLAHLNQLDDARELPILTVPPVVHLEGPPKTSRVSFGFLNRRKGPSTPYDPDVVGDRIAEAVARARARSRTRAVAPPWELTDTADVSTEQVRSLHAAAEAIHVVAPNLVSARAAGRRRERAQRWAPGDVPWFGGVQTPWGLRLDLLNISTTGLLVESASKFMPGSFSELHLLGSGRSLTVPARLVRSEVSEVNSRGVKYQTAAVFDRRLDLLLEEHHGVARAEFATPRVLRDLLKRAQMAAQPGAPGHARMIFEEGLRQLVRARDIRIQPVPAAPAMGEAVYFTVPTTDGSRPVLQASFEPDYEPAEEELSLLKIAASLAANVLESDPHALLHARNAW